MYYQIKTFNNVESQTCKIIYFIEHETRSKCLVILEMINNIKEKGFRVKQYVKRGRVKLICYVTIQQ